MNIPLYRWKPDGGENLGDYLSVPILRALGYEIVPPGPDRFFGIGTLLFPAHYSASGGAGTITVWGSAAHPEYDWTPQPAVQLDIRAVRGPVTAERLGFTGPQGDPALLLPTLFPPDSLPPTESGGTLYVSHCSCPGESIPGVDEARCALTPDGIDSLVLVARIARADFVCCQSLHSAITAAAYGVPWAPAGPCGYSGIKWADWFAYLGLPVCQTWSTNATNAKAWWERIGRYGSVKDVRSLMEVIP